MYCNAKDDLLHLHCFSVVVYWILNVVEIYAFLYPHHLIVSVSQSDSLRVFHDVRSATAFDALD